MSHKGPLVAVILSLLALSTLDAVVLMKLRETPGAVRISYSGSIDSSGLSSQGGLSASGALLQSGDRYGTGDRHEFQNFQGVYPRNASRYSVEYPATFSFTWNLDLSRVNPFDATAAGGDTFGFRMFPQSGDYRIWLNLPWQYVTASQFGGWVDFAGESFASMGLEEGEGFEITLPGGDRIVGSVVPEPARASMVAALCALFSLGLWRHTRAGGRS